MEYKGSLQGVRGLLRSPEVSDMLRGRADEVAVRARAEAPVGKDHHPSDGPRLRDSIEVVVDKGRDGRVRARVVANKRYAGLSDTAWLARSVDAAGF